MKNIKVYTRLVVLFSVLLQIGIWTKTSEILPKLEVIDSPPSLAEAKIEALGDTQLAFRTLAFNLQNSGDSFGRFTSLKNYDFKLVAAWLHLLDQLDHRSNFAPSIASYYYSNTQRKADNKYITEYLSAHYDHDPARKWWWMTQAVSIANFKMGDKELALKYSKKLADAEVEMPFWAKNMGVFILEKMGEKEQAYRLIKEIMENTDKYSEEDLNFMRYFVKERLGFLNKSLEEEKKKT